MDVIAMYVQRSTSQRAAGVQPLDNEISALLYAISEVQDCDTGRATTPWDEKVFLLTLDEFKKLKQETRETKTRYKQPCFHRFILALTYSSDSTIITTLKSLSSQWVHQT